MRCAKTITLLMTVLTVAGAADSELWTIEGPTVRYDPNWNSLDKRPLPSWYDQAKIGIFIHWGVYSVPSYPSEWFWMYWKGVPSPNPYYKKMIDAFMKANYKPDFTYQEFAKEFTAEFFNATFWAELIENSGARYVILTSKHHEGYAMWPSRYSYSWNSMDVGPHRDIVGELREAIVKTKHVRFGLYHSLYEWFHPVYLADKATNFTAQEFVNNKILPEMRELVQSYRPDIFWSDGEEEAPSEYWKSQEFLAWLYNESPIKDTVVVNDRWGTGTACKHGGVFTCQDRYNPGSLQNHKWENVMTIDRTTWGFNRASPLSNYMTTQALVDQIASTVSCGGNIVMNIGPAKDGTISPIFQERLKNVGTWLRVNGEAIYGSKPWDVCQNDTFTRDVWYTVDQSGSNLYVIMLRWPQAGVLELGCPKPGKSSEVVMLGLPDTRLPTKFSETVLQVALPDKALAPTNWGSVIKITNIGFY